MLHLHFFHRDENEKARWNCSLPSLSNVFALVIKNWITMKRSPVLFIFILIRLLFGFVSDSVFVKLTQNIKKFGDDNAV